MASADDETRDAAMERYPRLEARFTAAGGYAAESEAGRIASNLGLAERVLAQPLGTLSGGQRRRVELARILFSGAETLLLDEPTNHLDADSIVWLRDYLSRLLGRVPGDQPRRRPGARPWSTRSSTWTPTAASSTSTTSAGTPTCSSARRTSAAASASGPTPRRRPRRSSPRPTRCAPRPPRPSPRRTWRGVPSGCSPASRASAQRTRSRTCASPTRRRAAGRRSPRRA